MGWQKRPRDTQQLDQYVSKLKKNSDSTLQVISEAFEAKIKSSVHKIQVQKCDIKIRQYRAIFNKIENFCERTATSMTLKI